jgi:3',5'-cyclic AMP phosphodiesterase CpdA
MTVLLQISDTHFGTEQPVVVEALVALAAQQRPDVVVLSGDITQRARPAQFRAARAFLDRLAAPVLAIPGNHDIALFDLWSRLTRPYARYAAVFGAELEPVHETPELLLVGVNTTRAWRHKHGEVSAMQIDRVAQRLAAAGSRQLRVVVVHQPAAVTLPGDRRNLLRGHAAACQAWAAAGADVVMGGHIHLPFALPLPGLARRLCVVQAGTAVSTRVRPGAPNSVNLIRWRPGHGLSEAMATQGPGTEGVCEIERWDFGGQERGFARVAATALRPERGGPDGEPRGSVVGAT